MTLAWQIEALHRRKRLPKLETLLTRQATQVQTPRQQRTVLHVLSEQYGLPLRRARGRRRRRNGQ